MLQVMAMYELTDFEIASRTNHYRKYPECLHSKEELTLAAMLLGLRTQSSGPEAPNIVILLARALVAAAPKEGATVMSSPYQEKCKLPWRTKSFQYLG